MTLSDHVLLFSCLSYSNFSSFQDSGEIPLWLDIPNAFRLDLEVLL